MSQYSLQSNFKRPESVLVVIHTQDNQVLLLLRKDDPHFWQSVTGSLMEEESLPIVAAWRELKEETGLTQVDGTMKDCHHQQWFEIYPKWRHRYSPLTTRNLEHVFCFEVTAPKAITLSGEHIQYEWLPKEQAAKKVISETNRQAILNFVNSAGENNGRS